MPLPGHHAHVAGVERRLEQVLLMTVVVDVTQEDLRGKNLRENGSEVNGESSDPPDLNGNPKYCSHGGPF